jgi:hypothetical protein
MHACYINGQTSSTIENSCVYMHAVFPRNQFWGHFSFYWICKRLARLSSDDVLQFPHLLIWLCTTYGQIIHLMICKIGLLQKIDWNLSYEYMPVLWQIIHDAITYLSRVWPKFENCIYTSLLSDKFNYDGFWENNYLTRHKSDVWTKPKTNQGYVYRIFTNLNLICIYSAW